MNDIPSWIPYWIVIIVALIGAVVIIQQIRYGKQSETWPTITGKIKSSELKKRFSGRSGTSYRAAITYTYEVTGKSYECERIAFRTSVYISGPGMRQFVERTLEKYPEGMDVTVYYNPDKPEQATLENGVYHLNFLLLALDGLLLIALLTPYLSRAYEAMIAR